MMLSLDVGGRKRRKAGGKKECEAETGGGRQDVPESNKRKGGPGGQAAMKNSLERIV